MISQKLINKYNLSLNPDGSYDVMSNIWIDSDIIHNGKLKIKFNIVYGFFYCEGIGLTSLEGVPKKVNRYFSCSINCLSSLHGAPIKVTEGFYCYHNNLSNLDYVPISEKIYADYKIFSNTNNNIVVTLTNQYL